MTVDVPEPPALKDILVGFADIDGLFGAIEDVTVTAPAKLLRLWTVTVNVVVAPAVILCVAGLIDKEKSGVAGDPWTVKLPCMLDG